MLPAHCIACRLFGQTILLVITAAGILVANLRAQDDRLSASTENTGSGASAPAALPMLASHAITGTPTANTIVKFTNTAGAVGDYGYYYAIRLR